MFKLTKTEEITIPKSNTSVGASYTYKKPSDYKAWGVPVGYENGPLLNICMGFKNKEDMLKALDIVRQLFGEN